MISSIISRLVILVFGTLYPAYASYKTIRTKNLKEYVKWMMYWIVFALFTCAETFTDVFLSWFPFYYEVKIIIVLWLLSPATRGSSILYRKFVHPALCRREQEIDDYITKAKDQGYHTVLNLGTKGVNYATTVIMQTAIKGGGGLVQQLRRSYSLSDLSEGSDVHSQHHDEIDDVMGQTAVIRRNKRGYSPRRSASESSRSAIYFSDVDIETRKGRISKNDVDDLSHVKSSEDISSGYSSADNSIIGARTRQATQRHINNMKPTTLRRPVPAEDYELDVYGEFESDLHLSQIKPVYRISNTNPPFLLKCIGEEIQIVRVLEQTQIDEISDENAELFDIKEIKTRPSNDLPESVDTFNADSETPVVSTERQEIEKISFSIDEKNIKIDNEEIVFRVLNDQTESQMKAEDLTNANTESKKIEATKDENEYQTKAQVQTESINTIIEVNMANITSKSGSLLSIASDTNPESLDESPFETPEDSPKAKKKIKGKYGKSKAPSPPRIVASDSQRDINQDDRKTTDDNESLLENSGSNTLDKRKKRSKSRSPFRKSTHKNDSTLSKLKYLSDKMAFWSKGSSSKNLDNVSWTSSEVDSRRSSYASVDDNNEAPASHTEPKYGAEVCNDILDKSNALQQMIKDKIESHPEYKRVSLHGDEDVNHESKSTDV